MDDGINPILRTILEGVYDTTSPLNNLRYTPHLVQKIWKDIVEYWKSMIKIGVDIESDPELNKAALLHQCKWDRYFQLSTPDVFFLRCSPITFPKPKDININMMPFKMCHKFEDCYLPKNLRQYWKLLIQPLLSTERQASAKFEAEKICFLTIQESIVSCNKSQRRAGLHTETPGTIKIFDKHVDPKSKAAYAAEEDEINGGGLSEFYIHYVHWGQDFWAEDMVKGGIYMASNVPESCGVWNSKIECDESGGQREIIGKNGDIGFLRPYIGKQTIMLPNVMYWITDRTPHESLPLKEETYRQYFRLVTHQVSLWFEDHSTKNPFGLVPDPNITKIIRGSKFEDPQQLRVVDPEELKVTKERKTFLTLMKEMIGRGNN